MKHVHYYVVRLDRDEAFATHYWTGERWVTSARKHPKAYPSVWEASRHVPQPPPLRTYVWAENSKAKKTMFKPMKMMDCERFHGRCEGCRHVSREGVCCANDPSECEI